MPPDIPKGLGRGSVWESHVDESRGMRGFPLFVYSINKY